MMVMLQKGNRRYYLFVILLYFFILKDWLEQSVSVIGYFDELFALLAVPYFISQLLKDKFRLKIKRGGYSRHVIIFLLIGIIGSIIYSYQPFVSVALPDTFLCMKFWLSLYVGKQLFRKMDIRRYGKRIYFHVRLITGVYTLLVLVDNFGRIFPASIRYGLRSTQLMYSHPTVFVACCALLTMVLLSVRDYARNYKVWLIIQMLLICTTIRSKAFGTAMAIMLICYFVFYRKKKFSLRTLVLFAPLAVALGWNQIEYYFFSSIQSDSARYQLLMASIEVAKDHFPLGSGFGTFASYYSGLSYSPLYEIYGLTNVNGLRQGATSFVSDSFWPMVIGQTGFVGMVAFILAIVMLFKTIQKIRQVSLSYYASALCGMCYLLIASMAESAFVHPLAVPIAMMIGLMLSQNDRNNINEVNYEKIDNPYAHL